MIDLLDLYEHASKQLGRQLNEEEVDFLRWLFNRYSEEKQAALKSTLLVQESK